MKIQELTELLREQERLTNEFEELMERLKQHPINQVVDTTSTEQFQSLQRSREFSQEAMEKREQMTALLKDFNARLGGNVQFLQRVLIELDGHDEDI
ncbi:hypothetical protein [Deinococcus hopiensis]|uniref:FlgN protein n=1 Tax=Deinococcus hopiensis KR-140 TaxID=695939 RepID=A0A1W1URF3_9DEIO|nr:hypothetical protein [Deinococcus hopiensis]SMB83391.1 hypothetical protein SAMN00790413_04411 [Deinococcus hopiensis KR-140]